MRYLLRLDLVMQELLADLPSRHTIQSTQGMRKNKSMKFWYVLSAIEVALATFQIDASPLNLFIPSNTVKKRRQEKKS